MFFVIYDGRLRNATLKLILMERARIDKIYKVLKFWLDKILEFSQKDPDLLAKFSSVVFLGEGTWDYALEIRVSAAMIQLLITTMNLPLWANWGDMELEDQMVRLIYIFSSGSEVRGIPGQVIVAQVSDDDREIELDFEGKTIKITTLFGCIALLLTIHLWLYKRFDENTIIKEFNEQVKTKIQQALKM